MHGTRTDDHQKIPWQKGKPCLRFRRGCDIPPPGGHSTVFDGCVPLGFPKVGPRERIPLENEGYENFENLCLES